MGFFDKLNNLFGLSSDNQPQQNQEINRKKLDKSQIDDMQKVSASEKYIKTIHKKYYSTYPVKPFISLDREINSNWLEYAETFPDKAIIPINIMTPFKDGLLPGHIYLLYWIEKSNRKRVPSYFEHKYGIEFEKEKQFLINNGYLIENELTDKGSQAIINHFDIIEAHSPETTSRKRAQEQFASSEKISVNQSTSNDSFNITKTYSINNRNLMLVSDCDKPKIFEGIELINTLLKSIRKELKIQEALSIPISEIVFNKNFTQKLFTYFEYIPLTPKGKPSKFPFVLYITTREHYKATPNFECFGSIGYLKDNRIGNATLHFWYKGKGYHINLGMINDVLSVKTVEESSAGKTLTIYKK